MHWTKNNKVQCKLPNVWKLPAVSSVLWGAEAGTVRGCMVTNDAGML